MTPADPADAAVLPGAQGRALLRTFLDGAAAAVVTVNDAGRIVYCNPQVLDTFGYRPEELWQQPVEVLLPARQVDVHRRHRADFMADPRPRPMGRGLDLWARRKDGTEFPVEITLTPMTTDVGRYVVAGVFDVTDRRKTETRLASLSRAYLTLAQTNQAIVRASDATELFAETCRIAVEQGGYLGAWVGEHGPGASVRQVARAGSIDDYIDALRISVDPDDPTGQGPTAIALRESRSYYSVDFASDDRTAPWHDAASAHGIRASATMPLRRGTDTVAVLTLYSAVPGLFDAEMRALLEQMAVNVSFALDGFETERRLRQVAAQRSELLRRLVTAQESERTRIAADVHDDSVQALAAVDLRLGLLQTRVRQAAPDLEPLVHQIQATLAGATASLRRLLFELEPADPEADLVAAVREAAEHVFEDGAVTWEVVADEVVDLPPTERGQALRIAREALINVRKHAHARTVRVRLCRNGDGVEVAVTDDGVGVEPDAVPRAPGHRGLQSMRDRAEVSGGWCRIERAPEGGTTLRFWLPGHTAQA